MSVKRPYPPPTGWKSIERISPAKCTWTCEQHGIEQRARAIVAEKVKTTEDQLEMLKKQLTILDKPEEKETCETVYNYDYQIKGLSRPKYQAIVKALNQEELQVATRKNLKDRQTFLKFPHCLTNHCNNSPFYLAPAKDNKAVRSEYEEAISRNGMEMLKACQQFQ